MASKGPQKGGTKPVASKAAPIADKPVTPVSKPSAVVAAPQAKPATKPVAAAPATPKPAAVSKPVAAPKVATAPEAVLAASVAPVAAEAKPAIDAPAKAPEPALTPVGTAEPVKPATATAAPIAGTVTNPVDSAHKERTTMETITQTTEHGFAKGQALFADMNERAKQAMEKNVKLVEEMNDLAKGNVEAVVESTRIAAKGMESLGQEAAEFGRKSFEQATAMMKSLAAAKSPTEFLKVQSDFFRTSFDAYVAEASKHTEAMLKLAGDAAQPISNRVAVAAEKIKVAA